ncbi:MAG: hypothetical protein AAFR31_15990 [Cyanobacteria bacterium J06627_8]
MNRTPRRPLRTQPPLRGRSAACSSAGQAIAPPVVRPRPPIGSRFPSSTSTRKEYGDSPPELKKLFKWLLKLYQHQPRRFKFLYRLFQFFGLS